MSLHHHTQAHSSPQKLLVILITIIMLMPQQSVLFTHAQSDTKGPEIISLTLDPQTLSLESSHRSIDLTAVISDSSGIQSVTAFLTEKETSFKTTSKVSLSALSKSSNQETHFIILTLPEKLEEGIWELTIKATDKAGNTTSKSGNELSQGFVKIIKEEREEALSAPSDIVRVDAFEKLLKRTESGKKVSVIVKFKNSQSSTSGTLNARKTTIKSGNKRLLQTLQSSTAKSVYAYEYIPYITFEADAATLQDLKNNPDIEGFYEDEIAAPTLRDSIPLVGADRAFSSQFTGKGQAIAILDTGVDTSHSFLANKVTHEACFSSNFFSTSSVCPNKKSVEKGIGTGKDCTDIVPNIDARRSCQHGTHVAGIAAGNSKNFSGVAKDANIIALQVFSLFDDPISCTSFGEQTPCLLSSTTDQLKALEYVLEQSQSGVKIASANMSLGGKNSKTACDNDARKEIIDLLKQQRIATVISAGNSGSKDSVGVPGCISSAITVGSTTKSDDISSFSNVSSIVDLFAPGSSINSSVPGNRFAIFNGTSMSAPHVAGAWAVMKSALGSESSVSTILNRLKSTGRPLNDLRSGGREKGIPRIDLAKATGSVPPPTPTSAKNCHEILLKNPKSQSGVYTLALPNTTQISVYCDMKSNGGGWTLIGNRLLNGRQKSETTGFDMTTSFTFSESTVRSMFSDKENTGFFYETNRGKTIKTFKKDGGSSDLDNCYQLSGFDPKKGDFLKLDMDGDQKVFFKTKERSIGDRVFWGHTGSCDEASEYGAKVSAVNLKKDGRLTGRNEQDGTRNKPNTSANNSFARLYLRPVLGN